jgi:hypothetical protein
MDPNPEYALPTRLREGELGAVFGAERRPSRAGRPDRPRTRQSGDASLDTGDVDRPFEDMTPEERARLPQGSHQTHRRGGGSAKGRDQAEA